MFCKLPNFCEDQTVFCGKQKRKGNPFALVYTYIKAAVVDRVRI